MGAEHTPYLAHLRKRDSDQIPSDLSAVRELLEAPGWARVGELIEQVHEAAVKRLLFESAGSEGRVLEQAEYARLLGFLSGLGQFRVAAEAIVLHAERVRSQED